MDYQPRAKDRSQLRAAVAALAKFAVAVAMLLAAFRLVYGDAYERGYLDGMEDERKRNAPPPMPLAELLKRFPPAQPAAPAGAREGP